MREGKLEVAEAPGPAISAISDQMNTVPVWTEATVPYLPGMFSHPLAVQEAFAAINYKRGMGFHSEAARFSS